MGGNGTPEAVDGSAGAAPESGSNFYLGFLFLAKEKREALGAVYAFAREVDDIVDSGENEPDAARRLLEFWMEDVEKLYSGNPSHRLSRRLLPYVSEFRLPKEGFVELIRGVSMDLEKSRYETIEELERYMFGVAGAVGLLSVRIFGYGATSAENIRAYALSMGNAFQLTNIMRDVGADLERGRVYLPLADLREAGCSEETFLRREHSPGFEALMEKEYARAKAYYREARSLLHPDDLRAMLPAEVMAHVYEAILEKMRDGRYHVFFERTGLPLWRKAALAAKAWMTCR